MNLKNKKRLIKSFAITDIGLLALKSDLDLAITGGFKSSLLAITKLGAKPALYACGISNYFLWGFATLGVVAIYLNKTDKSKSKNNK